MKTIYHSGQIITMNTQQPTAQAIVIEEGLITFVGSNEESKTYCDEETQLIDLHRQVMIPAFIDSHSHFISLANSLRQCDLSFATSFEEIVQLLKTYIEKAHPKANEWIVASGYDQDHIKQGHPNKFILDQVSSNHPIMISHVSMHMGVINSKAIELLGIDSKMPDPYGGRYGRVDGSQEVSGFLEENAFITINQKIPMVDVGMMLDLMDRAQTIYASYGITTIQDGMVVPEVFQLLELAANQQRLQLDVVGYVDLAHAHHLMKNHAQYQGDYLNHFRFGGYKIFLDGSPQGRTAWMETPYVGEAEYYGYPTLSDKELRNLIETAIQEQVQLLAHCNGDAASNQYLTQFEAVMSEHPELSTCRPVMIHAQLLRKDQLSRVAKLHMIPSFFIAHTYYWGDTHIKNFTKERASQISPAHSCERLKIPFTLHQDSPVIMPNMLETMDCAINRVTKKGIILDEEECLTPYEALHALTINAAHQYFEEKRKGSIEPGKLADLVILDGNPLTTDKSQIKQIKVIQTIKEGKIIYQG